MDQQQACMDCGGEMELGFVPDISGPAIFQTSWQRGEPSNRTLLKLLKLPAVKYDRSQMIALTAMRCKQCGLLKLYAKTP